MSIRLLTINHGFLNSTIGKMADKGIIMKSLWCCVFTAIFLLVVSAGGIAYQERLILSIEGGQCSLRVEADDEARALRLRVYPGHPACYANKDLVQKVLRAAFSTTDPPRLEGIYKSLFLGRLIDYPWLCQHLALSAYKDPRWDRKKGKPESMDLHKYVSTVLSSREVISPFEDAFGNGGYKVTAVTLEKVLVGHFSDVPLYRGKMLPGKVPYDAMVWLRLEKR
jgi:hypothetical protein